MGNCIDEAYIPCGVHKIKIIYVVERRSGNIQYLVHRLTLNRGVQHQKVYKVPYTFKAKIRQRIYLVLI